MILLTALNIRELLFTFIIICVYYLDNYRQLMIIIILDNL